MTNKSTEQFRIRSNPASRPDGFEFPLRVLLYSHDSVGLGHLRRNLAIANQIAKSFPNSNTLIVTGSPCASHFQLPANTDMIKLPSISKDASGRYVSLDSMGSLDETLSFRSEMILNAFRLFKPTLVIVDHQVIGLKGEALDMLREAKEKGVLTFYGSRDIKDRPKVVTAKWSRDECQWALQQGYDRVCVYGMRELFDPREVYAPCLNGVPNIDFTGYIIPPAKKVEKPPISRDRKKVLLTFGGGGDGILRAETYLQALKLQQVDWDSHIITGPLMDVDVKRRIRKQAQRLEPLGSVKVQRFHRNIPGLLQQADAVVSMAGYNSCAEIMQSGLPAVLLPRSFPRQEQLMRAEIMADRGWVTFLKEEDMNPQNLLKAVKDALASPRRDKPMVDLNGLSALMNIIVEQLRSAGLVNSMPGLKQPRKSVS